MGTMNTPGAMKLYSDYPVARTAQIVSDVVAAVAVVMSIVVGGTVYATVVAFADFGRQLEGSGNDFTSTMADAADRLGDVPLIGDGVRSPFDQASRAGTALAEAGRSQQDLVQAAAVLLAVLVTVIPILFVMRYWLVRRVRFARTAREAADLARTDAGLDLLALRALADSSAKTLLSAHPSPVESWRRGDASAIRSLADLALRDAGVRTP